MRRIKIFDIIPIFFIILFLYTGLVKLMDIHLFQQQLSSSPLLSSLSGVVAWALPIGEILLAIALFIPKTQLIGLYTTCALMSAFTIYVIAILLFDDQLTCSCGGIIEELSPKQHILFNTACVILSIVGILSARRRQASPRFRWMTSSSVIGIFAVLGWLLFSAFTKPIIKKTGLEGHLIPSISLLLPDSVSRLRTDDIPAGKPFVLIGFSPSCIHCQAMTADIEKQISLFKDTKLYFITPSSFKGMQLFYRHFQMAHYPNIVMGQDSANALFKFFNSNSTPLVAIFDPKRRLKQVINGQITPAQLAQLVAN